MIYGIGTDIIEVARIEKELENNPGLKETLFSDEEIAYCESKKNKFQHYAARYAAKEAFFKALGTGWRFGMAWNEVEIGNDDLGKPVVRLKGKALNFATEKQTGKIYISISHLKNLVNAMVVIENK